MELHLDDGIVKFPILFVRTRVHMVRHDNFLRKAGVVKASLTHMP